MAGLGIAIHRRPVPIPALPALARPGAQTSQYPVSWRAFSMSRPARIALWIGGGLLALIVVAFVATILVVRTDWFRNYVREKIIAYAESATGGTVEIASFGFDWTHLRADVS